MKMIFRLLVATLCTCLLTFASEGGVVEDWEAAMLSSFAYDGPSPSEDQAPKIGWEREGKYEEPNGLGWSTYRRKSDGYVMVVFAGTRPGAKKIKVYWGDISTNFTGATTQFYSALSIVAKLKQEHGSNLGIAGHSKAGSLAQYASAMTKVRGWAFNTRPLDRKYQSGDWLGSFHMELAKSPFFPVSVPEERRISKENQAWANSGGVRIFSSQDDSIHRLEKGLGAFFFSNVGKQETVNVSGTRPSIYRDAIALTDNPVSKLLLWMNQYSDRSVTVETEALVRNAFIRGVVDPLVYGLGEGHSPEGVARAARMLDAERRQLSESRTPFSVDAFSGGGSSGTNLVGNSSIDFPDGRQPGPPGGGGPMPVRPSFGEKGVSMRMRIDESSFRRDETGVLSDIRDKVSKKETIRP